MEDLAGKRFGKLTVIALAGKSDSGRVRWLCRCDCGAEKVILAHCLKNGETKSCGCEHYKNPRRKRLEGLHFGRLVVEKYLGGSTYMCRCECGGVVKIKTNRLNTGKTKSCGCLRKEASAQRATKHGGATDSLYHVLNTMHQRCDNPNSRDYQWYGGKGVTVCPEWALANYPAFKDWAIRTGYQPGLTIDRINPAGPYSPDNCRWITIQAQQHNKRIRKD